MHFLKRLAVLVLILTGSVSPGFARQANEVELKMLDETVRIFQYATEKADASMLAGQMLSPRLIQEMARMEGIGEEAVVRNTRQQIAVTAGIYQFSRCDILLDERTGGELVDGSPYFIIPMESVLKIQAGQKVWIKSDIAAVFDRDRWYIVTGGVVHRLYIEKAYPGLEKASFREPEVIRVN
ncbi:MAG: Hypothetical protein BHV28_05040 [Candidatus Tokpelaia hoelldobleri]|uniref:Uncharacterized protein n=1 Tax=Candidatus Tokpelaia hoelldobleri TaxID=1902579 RepID=A0A1U9JTN1_9HYPH|nr:MAG: Hypothetical protein BHV28_05040 [Candidatus Tokpelaia hoelldoblerii]